ncbi:membrane protein [Parafrankia elaeagni]|uniref:membrane protein n=1 Tax=Parafrankia elaeagni TaxID=222534 RepID=UPI000375263C|nr:membrane protein [Parafrankia elaeagni]
MGLLATPDPPLGTPAGENGRRRDSLPQTSCLAVGPRRRSRVAEGAAALGTAVVRRPWLLTAVLCLISVCLGVTGPDTPAQEYRVWLFEHGGAVLWDDGWYGGHTIPGYSVLFPPLGALLGVQTVGALACIASTVVVTRLLRGPGARRGHDLALVWFAVATVANLVVGRMPFALGMAFGALALVGARERRVRLVWAGAVLSSLASPLAAGFVLMVGLALLGTLPRRVLVGFLGAGAGIAVALAFPEEGYQPFPAVTFLSLLTLIGVGLVLVPREQRAVRNGLLLWAASAIVFFFVPTQIGGNIARPATMLAGPAAAVFLASRPRALALASIPLIAWQIGPIHGALVTHGDPSASPDYYTELLDYLDNDSPVPGGRVEIPFTRSHWEARYVPPRVPMTRGWLRQLDSKYNALFYDGTLSAATYHEWLLARGVTYVALPNVELDPAGVAEAELLRSGLPYLELAWRNADWTVWLVRDSPGLVHGPATLTELDVSSVAVSFAHPGVATVLVHYTPYWQITEGDACVFRAAGGWTGILTQSSGAVRLSARLSVDGLTRASALDCPADQRLH